MALRYCLRIAACWQLSHAAGSERHCASMAGGDDAETGGDRVDSSLLISGA